MNRRVEMVLDLIDRGSRPVRQFMRLQERLGRVTRRTNEASARSSREASRASRLQAGVTRRLASAQRALSGRITSVNRHLQRQGERLRTNAALMRRGIAGTGRAALLAGGMFAAYAGTATAAAASFLGPARQFENFQVQLTSLEGSSEKARQAMGWIEGFATSTPLQLEQVVEAYQQMKTFGMDPTNGSLLALVDTMAASGKGAEHLSGLTLALGKSWTKGKLQGEEIMMLMERGVPVWDMLAEKTGHNVQQLQEMASAGKLGRAEIQLLIDAMGEKNAGASAAMSRTWDGIISNLLDNWTAFQRMVMGSEVFDWMKGRLSDFLEVVNTMRANGELQKYADQVAGYIMTGLKAIWAFGTGALETWRAIYPYLKDAADALGGWNRLALALVAIPLRGVLMNAAGAAFFLARGALGAGVALGQIGLGAVASGGLRLARSFLGLLNPIKLVRGAFIALRVALLASGIGAVVLALATAGTWIYNNWSGLTAMFEGVGEGIRAAMGPAGPIIDKVSGYVSGLIAWVGRLVGPINASQEQWRAWGVSIGGAIGDAINFIASLPGRAQAALASGWASVRGWMADMWSGLSSHAAEAWDTLTLLLLNYTPAGLVYSHWSGIKAWASTLWAGLIESAALAWEGLKFLLANYTAPGLIYSNWDGIVAFFADLWEQVKQIFAEAWAFIESTVIAPMRNAVSFMTDNKLTRGLGAAGRGIGNLFGGDEDVQARASGGAFNPGWLLTGESGPELEYRSRGGFIAHNDALQRMVAMSERVRRNAANVGRAPGSWARGAAVSAGVVAGAMAMPAAAESGGVNLDRVASRSASSGDVQLSANMTVHVAGSADDRTIEAMKSEYAKMAAQLKRELREEMRAKSRRSH